MSKTKNLKTRNWLWLGLSAAIAVILIVFWGVSAYSSPENVFWGMIDNNLSVSGVQRRVTQTNESGELRQNTVLRFGAVNGAHGLVTLTQKDQGQSATVKTESIGTSSADYSRYVAIEASQKNAQNQSVDFKAVTGVWGKSAGEQVPQFYSQTALGLVPFANLNFADRRQIIKSIKQKNVYRVNYALVKEKRINGQQSYIYTVNLDPYAYAQILERLAKASGLAALEGLNPSQYKNSQLVRLTLVVAKNSRQLIEISYNNNSQKEEYSGYGLTKNISLPAKTIPVAELQDKMQNIR